MTPMVGGGGGWGGVHSRFRKVPIPCIFLYFKKKGVMRPLPKEKEKSTSRALIHRVKKTLDPAGRHVQKTCACRRCKSQLSRGILMHSKEFVVQGTKKGGVEWGYLVNSKGGGTKQALR